MVLPNGLWGTSSLKPLRIQSRVQNFMDIRWTGPEAEAVSPVPGVYGVHCHK